MLGRLNESALMLYIDGYAHVLSSSNRQHKQFGIAADLQLKIIVWKCIATCCVSWGNLVHKELNCRCVILPWRYYYFIMCSLLDFTVLQIMAMPCTETQCNRAKKVLKQLRVKECCVLALQKAKLVPSAQIKCWFRPHFLKCKPCFWKNCLVNTLGFVIWI